MLTKEQKKLLNQKNKLMRYKLIKELYHKSVNDHPYTPTTQILEKYIYPLYPISRNTLYEIMTTSIVTLLKEIEDIEKIKNKKPSIV